MTDTSRIIDVPLRIHAVVHRGGVSTIDLADTPCPTLARQLAEVLVDSLNTKGAINATGTVHGYGVLIRALCVFVAGEDPSFAGGIADVRYEWLSRFLTAEVTYKPGRIRILLVRYDQRHPGVLSDDLRRLVVGKVTGRRRRAAPMANYSPAEADRIRDACVVTIEASVAAHRHGDELIAGGGRPDRKSLGDRANVLWLLNEMGPMSAREIACAAGFYSDGEMRKFYPGGVGPLIAQVFPTAEDVAVWKTLLTLTTGIPPEGVHNLEVGCVTRMAPGKVKIRYTKLRGPGDAAIDFDEAELRNVGDWSPSKLIDAFLHHSARLRPHLPAEYQRRLFCAAALRPGRPIHRHGGEPAKSWVLTGDTPSAWIQQQRRWQARVDLRDDNGERLALDGRRLRKTWYASRDAQTRGMVRRDPNHSERTAADLYSGPVTPTDNLVAIVEGAQRELIERSRRAPITVLTADELEAMHDRPAAAAARLKVPAGHAGEMLAGEHDVFVGMCRSFYHGPHGPAGKPCPARVWTCLFCQLAVITPSKLPNILRLLDHVMAEWDVLAADEWMAMWGAVEVRIRRDILPRYSSAELAAARAAIDAGADPMYLPIEERHS